MGRQKKARRLGRLSRAVRQVATNTYSNLEHTVTSTVSADEPTQRRLGAWVGRLSEHRTTDIVPHEGGEYDV